jgi:glycosyltransferase involved in cell wall biosynthesis
MYRKMFAEPGLLVLSSEVVRSDFLRFFPDLHEKPVRLLRFTSVMDDADYSADPVETCSGLGLPDKFIYLPNQIWQHKGFDTAFRALGILRKQGLAPTLVCTGNPQDYRNDKYFDELQEIIVEHGLGDQIVFLGMLPRATQLQIYRRAALTLQPSRFEGWSTSVEDARALGRPILLSDIDVHLEQAPAHATYFRVNDPADLAEKLASLWARLQPGPDADRERSARQDGSARSLAYARAFMSIAAEAAKSRTSAQLGYPR